jgi:hypothetical protein
MGEKKKNTYGILVGNPEPIDHYEDLDVSGRVILTWILEIEWDGMDWIDLAPDRDQWRALRNTVMNFRFP